MVRYYRFGILVAILCFLSLGLAAHPAHGAPQGSAPAFGTYAGAISVRADGFYANESTAVAAVLADGSVVGLPAAQVNASGMISFTLAPYDNWPAGQGTLVVVGTQSRHRYAPTFQLSRDAAENVVVSSSVGVFAPSFIIRASGFASNEAVALAALLSDGTSVGLPAQTANSGGYLEFPLAPYAEWPLGSVTVVIAGTQSQHRHLAAFQLVRESVDSSAPVWHGTYFGTIDFSGDPVLVRDDPALVFNWGPDSPDPAVPADSFSVRWTSTRTFANDGNYNIVATADDGVRVFIDDQLVLEGWYDHSATTYSVPVFVQAGQHTLRVDYFEHLANSVIAVTIAPQ